MTGLARREDYEISFAGLADEQREFMCGSASFDLRLRRLGVPVGGLAVLAAFEPDEELPGDLARELEQIDEVVQATGTQVLEMHESGGARADEFSISGRMERGILMVVVGDTRGSRLRSAAWDPDGEGGWKPSPTALIAAQRFGLPREYYALMARDLGGVLPPIGSPALERVRADDREAKQLAPGIWISYSSLLTLTAEESA